MKSIYIFLFFIGFRFDCYSQQIVEKIKKEYKIDNWGSFEERVKFDLKNIKEKGVILFQPDSTYLLTGYSYGEFYDWDLYFENIFLSNFGVSKFCFSNLKSFLRRQHLNGFVSRTLIKVREYQQFKPFLAQTALLGSKQINDYSWLLEKTDGIEGTFTYNQSYYERLAKYVDYWFWYLDYDKNGLPVWNSSDHSGMDNQISRAGNLNEMRVEGVDLACYLYRELKTMELLSKKLGYVHKSKDYSLKAKQLAEKINTVFWDEKDQFYYDRDERTGKKVKVKSVAGFIPLYIGIVSKERANSLIKKHLINPDEFWLQYPVAGYSKTEPDYSQTIVDWGCNWRGTTWIPTNYMIFHGLIDYGYADIAKELTRKTFDLVYKENEVTREYYNGETGGGLGLKPFWGWSNLAYLMPFELELRYDPTKIDDQPYRKIGTDILKISYPEN
jgi:hypothetical protein